MVTSIITGNIQNKKGEVTGMTGRQIVSYLDKDKTLHVQVVNNVRWEEDNKVEKGQKTRYEHPAEKDNFYIYKKPEGSKAKFLIQTTHKEGGIAIHLEGRSEGCILVNDTILDDMAQRLNKKKILTGSVNNVRDLRNKEEKYMTPLPLIH